jgi:formate--tetrahydrofolate ligase
VIVATIRALKMHGGGPAVKPGAPLSEEYTKENLELVKEGCDNLIAHIETVKKSGVTPVVCINSFYTDTPAEIALVREIAEANGALAALSEHWLKGGEGAVELAETVIKACEMESDFKFLYELETPLSDRIALIAKEVYGAAGVSYSDEAKKDLKVLEADPECAKLGTCMVKTHLSLSHDPELKNRPKGWILPIRNIMVYKGAGFIVPIAGTIKLMPGTASNPAYRRIDVDVETGKVKGLF